MLKDNVLMMATSSGVVGTTLLNAVQANPTMFQSVLGVVTILLQIILSFRQKAIEKRQVQAKNDQEIADVVKAEIRKQTNREDESNKRNTVIL